MWHMGMLPFYSSSRSCLKWEDEGRLERRCYRQNICTYIRANTGFVCCHILAISLEEPRLTLYDISNQMWSALSQVASIWGTVKETLSLVIIKT